MVLSVHQPQYLPWLGYFNKIAKSDCFVFLDLVQYKTREFQNRNKIRTKSGWIWLTVPVVSRNMGRQGIGEVMIDNKTSWAKKHLNSLQTWYGKSKFFDAYFPFFEKVYAKEWRRLIDLNIHIIGYLLKQFSIGTAVKFESRIGTTKTSTDRIIEICRKIKASSYLSGLGGKDYLEEEKFNQAKIKLVYQDFIHPTYNQQFVSCPDGFIPYMSAVDLLFNEGLRGRRFLV